MQSLCEGEETDPETGDHVIAGSGWNTVYFNTECGALTNFPITYGFETSEDFPANTSNPTSNPFGPCWRNEATVQNGSYPTRVWGTSTSSQHSGSQALVLPDKGNTNIYAKTMLVFPKMNFTHDNGYIVSLWINRTNTGDNPEGFKLYVSDCDTIGPNAVELGHYSRYFNLPYPVAESTSGWYQYETPVITMTGSVYIIFEGQSYYGSATFVDDIEIKVASTCNKPTDVAVYDVTAHEATLTWTSDATEWEVEVTDLDNGSTIQMTADPNPYTLLGLDPETSYSVRVSPRCEVEEWSDSITFTTPISCYPVFALNYDNLTSFSVNLSWIMQDEAQNAWQICLNDDENNLIDANTNEGFLLDGLEPNVEYTVKARAYCGENDYSRWCNTITFTTPEVCHTPKDLAANNITAVSADLSWTGREDVESYTVRYRSAENNKNWMEIKTAEWIEIWTAETETQLTDLNGGTPYEAQVRSDCNSDGWCDMIIFETEPDGTMVFVNEGDWNEADHWIPEGMPEIDNRVIIRAAATIPSGCVAEADSILLDGEGTPTIADGGQLIANNTVEVTAQKAIKKYTVEQTIDETLTDGWYFIASPITEAYTPEGSMTNNTYDLYKLNQTTWENFKDEAHPNFTTLANGQGYLYANSGNVTLSFNGTTKPYSAENNTVPVSEGWNLVGNPYTFETFANQSYYKMNDAGTAIEAVDDNAAIAPCTGIIVQATGAGTVAFTKEAQQQAANSGNIQIALAQATNTRGAATVIDNAIVSFNEGSALPKFRFGNHAEIYIPQGNEDYAIVFSEGQGEMPVSFKAAKNGTYTISVNTENVSMGYMHLIDNLTGNDVDLLATPSYTFNATTTDYASRFKLVFSANDSASDNFAFISDGNLIVNGEGTLQVIDMLGHILLNREAHSDFCLPTSDFLTSGVYVLRLINGDNVKTQKIVVR